MTWIVNRIKWGTAPSGETIESINIKHENGQIEVELLSLGATINRVKIPDKDGILGDIHYGRSDPREFFKNNGYQGSIVGRVASLIAFGRFELDGTIFETSKNMMGVHTQHGGYTGFDRKVWQCKEIIKEEEGVKVTFEYISPDGEEGFPGTLTTRITYTVYENGIKWEIEAESDKPTVINLTNHAYWNLDGLYKTIDNLQLRINANYYLHIDKMKLILQTILAKLGLKKYKKGPMNVRAISELENGRFRFSDSLKIGEIFEKLGDLDHNFIRDLNNSSEMKKMAELYSPLTGRKLELTTSEPALVVYSGNSMKGLTAFGKPVNKHYAICLEPMKPTNSIQIPELRNWVILRPGDKYRSVTDIKFGIVE